MTPQEDAMRLWEHRRSTRAGCGAVALAATVSLALAGCASTPPAPVPGRWGGGVAYSQDGDLGGDE